MNNQVDLKLGYVGIKNRSQQDIINKVPVAKSLDQEEEFFKTHPAYNAIPKEMLGTRALVEKLSNILFKQ